jgi:phosphomannomutase
LRALFRKAGAECWPLRVNLHLPEEVKTRLLGRLQSDCSEFLGRRVAARDRTDGLKMVFENGSWVLMRLSGTEPLVRVYTEAASLEESQRLADDTQKWILE